MTSDSPAEEKYLVTELSIGGGEFKGLLIGFEFMDRGYPVSSVPRLYTIEDYEKYIEGIIFPRAEVSRAELSAALDAGQIPPKFI